jgi:hypothetical protein
MQLCAAAEGLIAIKKISEALTVLDLAEQAFPKAGSARGLAYARNAGQTPRRPDRSGNSKKSSADLDGSLEPDRRQDFSFEVARSLSSGVRSVSFRLS